MPNCITTLPRLAIVVPCYNEEATLEDTIAQLQEKLRECIAKKLIAEDSYLFFMDDGSLDHTWSKLYSAHQQFPETVKTARLAANRGKEFSLWAALMEVRNHCDIAITTDADLQFDIHAINRFVEEYQKGYDVVYGIKENRGKQNMLRNYASLAFYWTMQKLGTPIERNQADYSLLTANALKALSEYEEYHILYRGLMKTIGFKRSSIRFKVLDRVHGESRFTMYSLINLSLDAITSFSVKPLRMIGVLGFLVFLVSLIMISWIVTDYFMGKTVTGWATLSVSIWLIGGLTMISMSVLGEYIGKTYMESKKRPRYYIQDRHF